MSENDPTQRSRLPAGLKITIVDDSRAFASGLRSILEAESCVVDALTDPVAAIQAVGDRPPDILLTDLEMPGMNGIELIHAIRAIPGCNETPILVLTSRDDPTTLINAIQAGADDFISKANAREVLIAKVLALARIRALHKTVERARQLDAVKSLIGTYKHEFGNTLTIIEGKLRKLEKMVPEISGNAAFLSVCRGLERFCLTLKKLDQLREYKEEEYAQTTRILKIG